MTNGFVELTVELTDARGSSNTTTIEYTITPVKDSPLATTLGDDTPAGDVTTAAVAINKAAATNLFRLRPYVSFGNNFFFSETNNNIQTASKTEVDFDFTYTLPTLVVGDPVNDTPTAISDHLTVFDIDTGIVGVDTTALTTGEATARLQYTVTDRNLNVVTNYIVVQAVGRSLARQLERSSRPAAGWSPATASTPARGAGWPPARRWWSRRQRAVRR